jgi:regulatory protein
MQKTYTVQEAQVKLEYFCSYQERCHADVSKKLFEMNMIPQAIDLIFVHLIENNFLNEERFACSFARGKHRIKFWGKTRIINELKARHISRPNIEKALKEITSQEYWETFEKIATRQWETIRETNQQKKRKKFCDYLLRKGFESSMVYEKMKELESHNLS